MIPIYYDAEFTGLHRNSSLISIGLVSECGSYLYAEFNDYDQSQVNDWLKEHVIDNLKFNLFTDKKFISAPYVVQNEVRKHWNVLMKGNREDIKNELLEWLQNEAYSINSDEQVQIYTDCYAYDWVLLNDLICKDGQALNIPKYINYIPIDLSTLMFVKGVDPDITREDFIGEDGVNEIKNIRVIYDGMGDDPKHNSLWDAYVAKYCFKKLFD